VSLCALILWWQNCQSLMQYYIENIFTYSMEFWLFWVDIRYFMR